MRCAEEVRKTLAQRMRKTRCVFDPLLSPLPTSLISDVGVGNWLALSCGPGEGL